MKNMSDSVYLAAILVVQKPVHVDIIYNADISVGEIRQFCKLQAEGQSLMREVTYVLCMSQLNLSACAYHRILKLARTIANRTAALQYRPKLRLG
jgi:predicted ATPase with chaperone activity